MFMESQFLSDQELIQQYLDGKESAFERLLNRYKDRVYSYILFTIKDDVLANDIFQETFMKVIRTLKRGKYNDQGKFLPWVNRIAHNLIIDYFRRNKKMPTTNGGEGFDIFDIISDNRKNVEEQHIKDQVLADVRKLVHELPDDQKEVLMMRMYFDMSFKKIANQTNKSIKTFLEKKLYVLINIKKMINQKKYIFSKKSYKKFIKPAF